jgi:transcription initiation factor IIE alpha subunit
MRNDSEKNCRGDENRHFIFKNFFSENSSVYEIMWNMVGPERPQKIKWRMRCMLDN